jgi:hypothetical protein
MCIYLFDFIYKNQKIFDKSFNFEEFKNKFHEYKIQALDLVNFAISNPISAGGIIN